MRDPFVNPNCCLLLIEYDLQEFGEEYNPTIGWQVDPFGHSATQPTLLGHEIGFDALYVAFLPLLPSRLSLSPSSLCSPFRLL